MKFLINLNEKLIGMCDVRNMICQI